MLMLASLKLLSFHLIINNKKKIIATILKNIAASTP
jgi:hypothetical protein